MAGGTNDYYIVGSRRQGHPKRRWSDVLDAFFNDELQACQGERVLYTGERATWTKLAANFIELAKTWTGSIEDCSQGFVIVKLNARTLTHVYIKMQLVFDTSRRGVTHPHLLGIIYAA